MSAAARSRAMPCTPVQSGRFGVRLISITGSPRPAHCGVAGADRRVGRQVDDAVVIVGNLQLGRRAQHAAAFDAADGADAERDVLAGNVGAGRREHAGHAGARVRRAADHLHRCAPSPVSTMQTRSRSALGCCLASITCAIDERRQRFRPCPRRCSTSSPIMVSLSTMLVERLVGVEMLLQPGEGEFHRAQAVPPSSPLNPPASVGKSSGRKP